MSPRVVFDTTVVVSALLFTSGRLAWLRAHWRAGDALPLASRATIEELTRVLRYPKFQLSSDSRDELLAEYLPYNAASRKLFELIRRNFNSPRSGVGWHGQVLLPVVLSSRDTGK